MKGRWGQDDGSVGNIGLGQWFGLALKITYEYLGIEGVFGAFAKMGLCMSR